MNSSYHYRAIPCELVLPSYILDPILIEALTYLLQLIGR
nr:MAG TPA: hypothetical protein [Bacteriophage sp.]